MISRYVVARVVCEKIPSSMYHAKFIWTVKRATGYEYGAKRRLGWKYKSGSHAWYLFKATGPIRSPKKREDLVQGLSQGHICLSGTAEGPTREGSQREEPQEGVQHSIARRCSKRGSQRTDRCPWPRGGRQRPGERVAAAGRREKLRWSAVGRTAVTLQLAFAGGDRGGGSTNQEQLGPGVQAEGWVRARSAQGFGNPPQARPEETDPCPADPSAPHYACARLGGGRPAGGSAQARVVPAPSSAAAQFRGGHSGARTRAALKGETAAGTEGGPRPSTAVPPALGGGAGAVGSW